MSHFSIRRATDSDLDAIKELADAHKRELGFVIRPALARSIEREELLIAENHAGVIGFVEYHHRQDEQTTLYHIAVAPDYRCMGVGKALIGKLCEEAVASDKQVILLKCPIDLPAHGFYDEMGFEIMGSEAGKERSLIIWGLPLDPRGS